MRHTQFLCPSNNILACSRTCAYTSFLLNPCSNDDASAWTYDVSTTITTHSIQTNLSWSRLTISSLSALALVLAHKRRLTFEVLCREDWAFCASSPLLLRLNFLVRGHKLFVSRHPHKIYPGERFVAWSREHGNAFNFTILWEDRVSTRVLWASSPL